MGLWLLCGIRIPKKVCCGNQPPSAMGKSTLNLLRAHARVGLTVKCPPRGVLDFCMVKLLLWRVCGDCAAHKPSQGARWSLSTTSWNSSTKHSLCTPSTRLSTSALVGVVTVARCTAAEGALCWPTDFFWLIHGLWIGRIQFLGGKMPCLSQRGFDTCHQTLQFPSPRLVRREMSVVSSSTWRVADTGEGFKPCLCMRCAYVLMRTMQKGVRPGVA